MHTETIDKWGESGKFLFFFVLSVDKVMSNGDVEMSLSLNFCDFPFKVSFAFS